MADQSVHDERTTASDPVSGPQVLDAPRFTPHQTVDEDLARLASLEGRVSKDPKTAAVIVAGGSGSRFGRPGGKQLLPILGKPMLTWSAEAFDAVPDVGLIVIVCPEDLMEEYCRTAVDPYPFATPIVMAPSGQIRQESSMSGVDAVPEDFEFIAIHDGARPLVVPAFVEHAISMLKGSYEADGVVIGHAAIDTLKVVRDRKIMGTPDRSAFWVAQTPQIFRADICRRAFAAAMAEGFVGTDDSSLVERIGGHVLPVDGPRDNLKITVPEDLAMATAALSARLADREGA